MEDINRNGKYLISKDKVEKINKDFISSSLNNDEILNTIKIVYEKYKIILDPHTAIGFGALEKLKLKGNNIVLSTAHPCKFPDAINRAIKIKPELPSKLKHVLKEKENYEIISNNLELVKKYIRDKIL